MAAASGTLQMREVPSGLHYRAEMPAARTQDPRFITMLPQQDPRSLLRAFLYNPTASQHQLWDEFNYYGMILFNNKRSRP